MGLKERLSELKKRREKTRSGKLKFKKKVDTKTLKARREAYEEESIKVAREKGKQLARRKSFGEVLSEAARRKLAAKPKKKPQRRQVKVVRRMKKAKRKQRPKAKTKTVVKYVERPAPKDDLFYGGGLI